MGKVKLKDIAANAGVSISTVSRILSGDDSRKSSSETIERVRKEAERLGYYQYNPRTPRQSISLACIFVSDNESVLSPFFSEIVTGIREEIASRINTYDIQFTLIPFFDELARQRLAEGEYDIGIVLGRTSSECLEYIRSTIPVTLYAGLNRVEMMDQVLYNSREGMADAVSALFSAGCRQIAYLGVVNAEGRLYNEHRYAGFVEGLEAKGLAGGEILKEDIFLTAAGGYEGAARLLSRSRPDGIVCANDMVAAGVLKYLAENGIRVPEEVCVTGFDNIESSAFLTPTLTTFDVPKRELGHFALRIALERMFSPRDFNITVNIPYSLIIRESIRR